MSASVAWVKWFIGKGRIELGAVTPQPLAHGPLEGLARPGPMPVRASGVMLEA